MCLSVAVSRPDNVLATGHHAGFEWSVVHNGHGHRCGYIKLPPEHPWYGEDHDDIDADVHGGLTFAAPDVDCGKGGPDNGWWIGFDCAHAGDAPDYDLPGRHHEFRAALAHLEFNADARFRDVVRTQEYVEAECRSLCEQAARAAQMGASDR